jgi:hypothetical protein
MLPNLGGGIRRSGSSGEREGERGSLAVRLNVFCAKYIIHSFIIIIALLCSCSERVWWP